MHIIKSRYRASINRQRISQLLSKLCDGHIRCAVYKEQTLNAHDEVTFGHLVKFRDNILKHKLFILVKLEKIQHFKITLPKANCILLLEITLVNLYLSTSLVVILNATPHISKPEDKDRREQALGAIEKAPVSVSK
ncbi:hypothetical protein PR202_ga23045 [Eleusine coracana subsp. coracana]|uniref:Uncharacterized protein n=1 Tax=Eleusine coracana subsp. coracana TaxID=191504 RepID=A0AAV5D5I9_ELECO|nr:hypothetical protein PR202_ga23045 [Eleusine coracana subsp. coracana]